MKRKLFCESCGCELDRTNKSKTAKQGKKNIEKGIIVEYLKCKHCSHMIELSVTSKKSRDLVERMKTLRMLMMCADEEDKIRLGVKYEKLIRQYSKEMFEINLNSKR